MTAPLYLVEPGVLDRAAAGAYLVLDGEEGRHAATVRRTRVGERLDVADGAGRLARCLVAAVGPGLLELTVEQVTTAVSPSPRIVLVQALAKGGRDELAVETATELGIDEVVPWQAGRCVVVWSGERGRRGRTKWAGAVRAAAKQSRRARVPDVAPPVDTAQLAEQVAGLGAGALVLVLHEAAPAPLAALELPSDLGQIWIVVGPEGGIEPGELDLFAAAGARVVRLGPHVLRSSSAGPAAVAVLAARLGRWT